MKFCRDAQNRRRINIIGIKIEVMPSFKYLKYMKQSISNDVKTVINAFFQHSMMQEKYS